MTDKCTLLQKILKALGLSQERIETILAWIEEWRAEEAEETEGTDTEPSPDRYPYHLRDDFLTPAELHFYRALLQAADDWATICPKTRLGDLFKAVTPEYRRWQIASNKINQKHVDFVLCDPKTMQPLLGIELNDSSHQRQDRQERDEFVVRTFAAAGLPLVGIKVQGDYPVETLARFLKERAGVATGAGQPREVAEDANGAKAERNSQNGQPPVCPECRAQMVLRTARRGGNAGNQFWGCSRYPECRGIRDYEASAV